MSIEIQDHDASWHARRRKILGASEVAAVIGVSRWSSAVDVWESKVNNVKSNGSMATNLGHLLQPVIGKLAADKHALEITGEEVAYTHEIEGWAGATIDYIAKDKDGRPRIVECKATRDQYWSDIPSYYRTQLAWQCWTSGIQHATIAVLHASTNFQTYEFDLAEDGAGWFTDMVLACRTFWFGHVLTGVRPEGFSADPETLANIRAISGKTLEMPESYRPELSRLVSVRSQIKELERIEEDLKSKFQTLLGDSEILIHNGQAVMTWKESESNRFDTTALKKADPEKYQEYLKTSYSRRFLVK